MAIGGVLTAMVTPFDASGAVDEDAFVRLLGFLADNGSDGVVVAGTTGESSTLTDDEKLRLFELAGAEGGDLFVIAGTGSNNTAHSVHLTEKASHVNGVDAILAVTPYYNKPPLRGVYAHMQAISDATDKPVIVYNIPGRCVIDLPNDFLRSLAQIENVKAVKQARETDITAIEGLDLLAGNDDRLAEALDAGGTGGILVASHIVGKEMRRMLDEPQNRWAIHEDLTDTFNTLVITQLTMTTKAALKLLGQDVGGVRLPLVECDENETAALDEMLRRRGLLSAV
ncbi:MAG TPA: 4-hydroxy-tetrahydrodipicolinate synthase [Thermoleophilaceae bacterium]|nr:4-hydroxy-tetrahydrodipicolinate synthase [Thermoleophilaceae bacterium]